MPDSQPLQIDYRLTRKDLASFWRERWEEPSFRRGMWALYAVAICWMVGSSVWNARGVHRSARDLRDEIVVETGIVLVFCGLTKWWLPQAGAFGQAFRRNSTGSFSIRISPQSLTARANDSERETPWNELVAVNRTPGHLVLCERSGRFYTIPVQAFPTPAAADAFYQSAYEWHAAVKANASV